MTYARFKPLYAKYWVKDPTTFYKVRDYSNSGLSAYLITEGGRIEMVPVCILDFVNLP